MLSSTKQLLDKIIIAQEGGWKLTSNANDPDGGWTFGGATETAFSKWYTGSDFYEYGTLTKDNMERAIDNEPEHVKQLIEQFYEEEYIGPLQLEKLPGILQGPMLSCAINCGVETAVKILQSCVYEFQDGKLGSKTLAAIEKYSGSNSDIRDKFLREWTRHYIQLVVENAKAWHTYILYKDQVSVYVTNDPKVPKNPNIFRAPDLEGWFNRVEYWRQ